MCTSLGRGIYLEVGTFACLCNYMFAMKLAANLQGCCSKQYDRQPEDYGTSNSIR